MAIHCDRCDRTVPLGESYHETLSTIRVVGGPPPMYGAKVTLCNECDRREAEALDTITEPERVE